MRFLALVTIALGPAAVVAAPLTGAGVGLPEDLSTEGWRIDQALGITHVFVLTLCAVAFVWMVAAVWRGRKRTEAVSRTGDGAKAAMVPLLIAAVVFFVVDGHLFVSSTRDNHTTFRDFDRIEREEDVLRLQISGRQWAWDARYAGVDGRFGSADDVYVTTDITVPAGRPVLVQLAAVDVVHALYVPNLRVQQDAIPGRVGMLWFEVARVGDLEIACAQHCGVNHYKMSGVLHVLDSAEFDAWLAQESRYAVKMIAARAELPGDSGPGLFPRFSSDPDVAPRGWGWPWQEGRE